MTLAVSSKGWVVIPAELRRKYRLKPGTAVQIVDYGGVLAIVPALENPLRQTAGLLASRSPEEKPLTQALLEERRREQELNHKLPLSSEKITT